MEELVSYLTAKLAKDKGFIQSVYNQKLLGFTPTHPEYINEETNGIVSAPTQSLLCKWLRDIHNINIEIKTPDGKKGVWLYKIHKIHGVGDYSKQDFAYQNYEQALEAALEEALKLVIIPLPSLDAGN
ncbi:hypothetical protein BOX09_gp77 [Flavobacterium phage Fpv1]|uniref:Uncharacterized protein n=2 Tax=Fipvunavirus Fpv1 TaxID=2560475 RepID=A0A1B0WKK1_9CAUD|nr:hypothetical protein BOW81_gp77 [Flavobacterium phage Fpv20]YP_009322079.1 hypothetical protein BOX09_gp77 [Flavobacterium phage Fpv1]YP_009323668.1 hypothetical protein BOW82_gp77 [Flavobacterium phage Fpv2]ALN97320.1 hypothetical protein [Flavobacterium phage FpV21]QCW20261.1 hypothetical protein [Flavobacterium phage FPSV-F12]QCW20744.1 hypothetical protein [Flavobacterium phage FPSV-S29]ANB40319.1 hypothetical protein [Flavobacterium phage Fpv1]ANB40399.1 hypothetical protein [Flavoba